MLFKQVSKEVAFVERYSLWGLLPTTHYKGTVMEEEYRFLFVNMLQDINANFCASP